jgi:uncharacterized Zn-binding protein involved in type VI secretion
MTTRPGYVWDATASQWVEIGQAAVLAPIKYQTSQPSSPATGDIWIDSDEDVPSVDSTLYYRWTKTMSGGETSLSGTDNNSLALKYTPGYESVFINGVLQVRGSDYVATTGTTVTGLIALTASDVVMVESIIAYSVGDTYTQAVTDTKLSSITSGFRNAIINGGFDIWQRGTSFTPSSNLIYTADRFFAYNSGNGSMTVSRQTFTPGNTISGYEPQFFLRTVVASVGTSTLFNLGQRIEDVRKFAGQTVTVSFWMKSDASRTVTGFAYQLFGTGGSTFTMTQYGTFNVTTSWQRFTATVNIPSISGKTIGADSYLAIELNLPATTQTTEIWGMQVEAGSVATPFEQRPIGTELALCQRYYWRGGNASPGIFSSASLARYSVRLPVSMRIAPTISAIAAPLIVNPTVTEGQTGSQTTNFIATAGSGSVTTDAASQIQFGGFASAVDGRPTTLLNNCLEFSAEL